MKVFQKRWPAYQLLIVIQILRVIYLELDIDRGFLCFLAFDYLDLKKFLFQPFTPSEFKLFSILLQQSIQQSTSDTHMLNQQQKQVNMLQKQTMYGLNRQTSNSTKDLTKGVRKSLQPVSSSRTGGSSSQNENPFAALKDRDMNQNQWNNEQQRNQQQLQQQKSNEKRKSANSLQCDRSAKKPAGFGNQYKQSLYQPLQRSSTKTKSPALSGRISNPNTNGRISNAARSPTTTSLQSSGKKTPCISALVQHNNNLLPAAAAHQQLSQSQSTLPAHPQIQYQNPQQQQMGQRTPNGASAENSSDTFVATSTANTCRVVGTTRYEMTHDELIAEEENDGSSFLQNEREAQQQVIEEEATDDARSQLSQNLIGAHLIKNQDLYPFRAGSAFQTPKPSREALQSNCRGALNNQTIKQYHLQSSQSPMTSYRNQMLSNIQSQRQDMLQMSQKTTVTNKITNSNGRNARIGYENDHIYFEDDVAGGFEDEENAYFSSNYVQSSRMMTKFNGFYQATKAASRSPENRGNQENKENPAQGVGPLGTEKNMMSFQACGDQKSPQSSAKKRSKRKAGGEAAGGSTMTTGNKKATAPQGGPQVAIRNSETQQKKAAASWRIEQLSSLALNVRKQTSPESRSSARRDEPTQIEAGQRTAQVPEVHLSLVDHSSSDDLLVRNTEQIQMHPDQTQVQSIGSPDYQEAQQQDSQAEDDSPDLKINADDKSSAEMYQKHHKLSTIPEVIPSATQTFCLTVQPTTVCQSTSQNCQYYDDSYDQQNATRLIDDNSKDDDLTPDSVNKPLDPYQRSVDMSQNRFSSVQIDPHNRSCSPANIILEPVRMVNTTAFEQQKQENSAFRRQASVQEVRKASISPVKKSATPSPQKPSPQKQPAEVSILTDQSYDQDAGNPVLARSMFENLKRIESEAQMIAEDEVKLNTQKYEEVGYSAQKEDEACATISASDVAVKIDTTVKSTTKSGSNSTLQQRPLSSNGQLRRRRDQRKTPSGRNSVNQVIQGVRQQTGIEESKRQKRAKFSTGMAATRREKCNTSASPLEQPVVSAKTTTNHEDGAANHARQRSTSANRTPSVNGGNMRRSNSTNQSCNVSLQEQIRLANLQRAKQYGNRMSSNNRSGLPRQTSSPSKKGMQLNVSRNNFVVTPEGEYSPVKPEILQACDLSVSAMIHPRATTSSFSTAVALGGNSHSSTTHHSRKNTLGGVSSKLSSHNSSIKRHKRHEMKLSRPAQQAKMDFMKKSTCARKIQKCFRDYLKRQAEIERELAEEAARQEQHMIFVNQQVRKIQGAFKVHMCRQNLKRSFEKRQRLKMIVTDLVTAWKTRRSLNCLGSEVQEFVNCENDRQRGQLRSQFHSLFQKVIQNKLYLEDNFEMLQKLRQQIALKAQQQQQQASKERRNQPSNCAKRARQRLQQIVVNSGGSPFKKDGCSPAPRKTSSPIRASNKTGGVALNNQKKQENKSFQNAPVPRQHKPSVSYQLNQGGSHPRSRTNEGKPLQRNGSSQRRIGGAAGTNAACHKNSTGSINSLSRQQLHQQHSLQQLQQQQQQQQQNQNGTTTTLNVDDSSMAMANTVRNSYDNQAINELRNFIQNSDKKNESFCSIQVSTCKNKLGGPNGTGQTNQQSSVTNLLPRESSNGKANAQQQAINNSQVVVQVHNGSLADLISPSKAAHHQNSDAKPVNIMLGSCTRFSRDMNSGRKPQQPQYGGQVATGDENQAEVNKSQASGQAALHIQTTAGGNGPISRFDPQLQNQNRRVSQQRQEGGNSAEYRQNLRRVRPRVDCWNRSATRGGDTTPSNRLGAADQQQQNQAPPQMSNIARMDSYRRSDSGVKMMTPSNANGGLIVGRTGNHVPGVIGSFSAHMAAQSSNQKGLVGATQQQRQNQAYTTGPTPQQHRQPIGNNTVNQAAQQSNYNQQQPQGPNESFNRSRSTNQVMSASGVKRQQSMLREPTKFATNQPTPQQITTKMPGSFNHNINGSGAVNHIEQLSRPKSSSNQPHQQVTNGSKTGSLRQFITGTAANRRNTGGASTAVASGLNTSGSNLGSSRLAQVLQHQPIQTQFFEMRETLANLTQVMETLASEAEANQRQMQRDASLGRGSFGLNSQYRATMKAIQAHERQFSSMMEALQGQFSSFRELATPTTRNQNNNINQQDSSNTNNC